MQAYNPKFAKIYNSYFTMYVLRLAPIIESFYATSETANKSKNILDLCCGTGQLAHTFLEKGYKVLGVDASESMLDYARANTREFRKSGQIEFLRADISNLGLLGRFGLITCTYDSINHLDGKYELLACLENTYKNLIDGGFFIFDINTKLSLMNWNNLKINENVNGIIIARGSYDGIGDKAYMRISGFNRSVDNNYERFSQIIINTVYDTEFLRNSLLSIGWNNVYFAKTDNLHIPINEPENIDMENEVIVVAEK
jgi:SAM-dependent methyltransferase